jgi:ABC-type multidrug transport system ATPase subunit
VSERFQEPGVVSVRSQIGIVAEDPRIFRPYTVDEALRCAAILRRDLEIPGTVRRLLSVGLPFDLLPGHLSPSEEALGRRLRIRASLVEDRRVLWECVEPGIRFDLARRASAMILVWRGSAIYGV